MYQSIPAAPIPWATVGHLPTCQSWGWGIRRFCMTRGSEKNGAGTKEDTK